MNFSSEESPIVDPARRRGRGALSNESGRFERERRVEADDGWSGLEELGEFRTNVHVEKAKTIITQRLAHISFDRSVNPYRGCEHGCVYCYARPSHAYMGLSPGLDFETEIYVKEGAAQLLERELSARNYSPKTIAIAPTLTLISRSRSAIALPAACSGGGAAPGSSDRHRDQILAGRSRHRYSRTDGAQ